MDCSVKNSDYMVCDNPLCGPETYILHTVRGFLIRVSDHAVIAGRANKQAIDKAKAWYCTYLQFLEMGEQPVTKTPVTKLEEAKTALKKVQKMMLVKGITYEDADIYNEIDDIVKG
jgi:hypothetical protein